MTTKRIIAARNAAARIMAFFMVAILALSAVTPAYAATGNTVASMTVVYQSGTATYGSIGSVTYEVTATSTGGTGSFNVALSVTGLPVGATGTFSPKTLQFASGVVQTKTSSLVIATSTTTPAGNSVFTVRNKKNTVSKNGTLTVGQRTLGVAGKLAQDKVYDGTTNVSLNPACPPGVTTGDCAYLTSVLGSDVVTLDMSGAVGTFDSKDVAAPRNVNVTGLAIGGTGASNYRLPLSVGTTANISKAALTVTADPSFKAAGFPDQLPFTFAYGVFKNSETSAVIDTAPTCSVPADHDLPGTYDIVCAGGSDNNYEFDFHNGTLTVNNADSVPTDIALSNSTVGENLPVGTTVGTLTTTDADSILGETYSYGFASSLSCDGADNGSFQISSSHSTGPVPLRTSAKLHYVTKSSYSICVETNDGNGGTFDKHFTVTVLPTTTSFASVGIQDGWVLESSEISNIGGSMNSSATTLRVGDDAANKQYRSILTFTTSSLPDNATIYKISIKVRKAGLVGAPNIFTQLQGLRVDIRKPAFGLAALQLSDFQALVGTSGKASVGNFKTTPDSLGWYSVNLASGAFPYLNKVGITQFRLRFSKDDNNNHLADYLSFYSGDWATAASRPQLIITYSAP